MVKKEKKKKKNAAYLLLVHKVEVIIFGQELSAELLALRPFIHRTPVHALVR